MILRDIAQRKLAQLIHPLLVVVHFAACEAVVLPVFATATSFLARSHVGAEDFQQIRVGNAGAEDRVGIELRLLLDLGRG